MADFEVRKFTLRTLKEKFDERTFAVPDIQRSYVWKRESICKLMDSIFRNYPIGMAMVWEVPAAKAVNIRPNTKTILPPFNKKVKTAGLIIDGQQRLSTIYGVLVGSTPKEHLEVKINFRELYFDCRKGSERRFQFNKIFDENTKGVVRLTDLLNSTQSTRRKMQLNKGELEQAEQCYNAFFNFKFYISTFSGFDFDDVREIFVRVNSAGMRISRADNLFALSANVSLRDHVYEVRRGLKNGFNEIPVEAMQNTVALMYGAENISSAGNRTFLKQINSNGTGEKEFFRIWKDIEYGFTQAADFLASNFEIRSVKELASQNIFSMLAFFFAKRRKRADRFQAKQIRKWYWHTCCAERYSGRGFNKNVPSDIKFFKLLSLGRLENYRITDLVDTYDFLKSDYRVHSGATLAYFSMMRGLRPLYLVNGYEILLHEVSSRTNRKDRHHIFPIALLKKNLVNEKWAHSIGNICYLEADENQSIGNSHPKHYLLNYKNRKHFGAVMKSHLINVSKNSPIWMTNVKEGFDSFLKLRGDAIIKEIERLAGDQIFARNTYNKRF